MTGRQPVQPTLAIGGRFEKAYAARLRTVPGNELFVLTRPACVYILNRITYTCLSEINECRRDRARQQIHTSGNTKPNYGVLYTACVYPRPRFSGAYGLKPMRIGPKAGGNDIIIIISIFENAIYLYTRAHIYTNNICRGARIVYAPKSIMIFMNGEKSKWEKKIRNTRVFVGPSRRRRRVRGC